VFGNLLFIIQCTHRVVLSLCLFVHLPLLLFDYTVCYLHVTSAKSERGTQTSELNASLIDFHFSIWGE